MISKDVIWIIVVVIEFFIKYLIDFLIVKIKLEKKKIVSYKELFVVVDI